MRKTTKKSVADYSGVIASILYAAFWFFSCLKYFVIHSQTSGETYVGILSGLVAIISIPVFLFLNIRLAVRLGAAYKKKETFCTSAGYIPFLLLHLIFMFVIPIKLDDLFKMSEAEIWASLCAISAIAILVSIVFLVRTMMGKNIIISGKNLRILSIFHSILSTVLLIGGIVLILEFSSVHFF